MRTLICCVLITLPCLAFAKYEVSDLLKKGTDPAEYIELGLDPSLNENMKKFMTAMKNPVIFHDLEPKLKPGGPTPYDPRFGFSEADYNRLLEGIHHMSVTAN